MLKRPLYIVLLLVFLTGFSWARDNLVPNVKFDTTEGKRLSFKDLRGKVLLINFFATYCAPCQVELAEFSEIYKKLHHRGLEIVSFLVNEDGELLLPRIIQSRKIEYHVAVADESILAAFGWPDMLPTTFVVDRRGHIVRKIIGFAGKRALEEEIKKLLEEGI
jgi:cytochrome c biogenesis protein CcmG/thiol:disulfide interchange protein DsbE